MSWQCTENYHSCKPAVSFCCVPLSAFAFISVWVFCLHSFIFGLKLRWQLKLPALQTLVKFKQLTAVLQKIINPSLRLIDEQVQKALCQGVSDAFAEPLNDRADINIIPTLNYIIYNNIHFPQIKSRQINMNNMLSKCPRLHIRARTEKKKKERIFLLKPCLFTTGWVLSKGDAFMTYKKKSSSHIHHVKKLLNIQSGEVFGWEKKVQNNKM